MSKNNEKIEDKAQQLEGISPEVLARFRPAENEYTTKTGVLLKFRPISAGILERAQARIETLYPEPQPPMTEIDHGKGRTSQQPNVRDDWYLLQHAKWRRITGEKLGAWTFGTALEVDVPPWEVSQNNPVYWGACSLEDPDELKRDPHLQKYLYVCSLLESEEYQFLFEAIIGNRSITKAGLQEAAADFRG